VDPIPELAALAAARGISFHVDACVGGFLLPFWERLGEPVPPFDFRVDGVTTMSADVHKYGYCVKGASVLVHRDETHLKKYQRFLYTDWPGGLYFSQAIAGTRPAPPIAAAWAVTRRLGIEGYLALTRRVREATQKIQAEIEALPGLRLVGAPVASVFAFTSDRGDPFAIADQMEERGWGVDRQRDPDAMHVMISPRHADVVDEFLADLRSAAETTSTRKSDEARYS
jgi:glutamate/tyrosine decarboxylase-like PLP-dependent enzyme